MSQIVSGNCFKTSFFFRLQYAKRLLSTGIERGPVGLLNGKEWLRKVERDLAEAIKNNDFIYHERIPEERTLAPVAKAAVAKPTPLPERSASVVGL